MRNPCLGIGFLGLVFFDRWMDGWMDGWMGFLMIVIVM